MMKWSSALGGAVTAFVMVGMLTTPSFAASGNATIDYVSQIKTGANPLYDVAPPIKTVPSSTQSITIKVSGLQTGVALIVWEMNSSGTYVADEQLLYSGHGSYNGPSTEVFKNVPIAPGTEEVAIREGTFVHPAPGKTQISLDSSDYSNTVSLNKLPFGELPEVPWAAALPVVGLGLAALAWRRRRQSV